MRTTLSIDDDVMLAAKAMAEHRRTTVGAVISQPARQGLRPSEQAATTRHGLPIYDRKDRSVVITLDLVNALRDEE